MKRIEEMFDFDDEEDDDEPQGSKNFSWPYVLMYKFSDNNLYKIVLE
jgi:hypothetical protein